MLTNQHKVKKAFPFYSKVLLAILSFILLFQPTNTYLNQGDLFNDFNHRTKIR